MKKYAYLGIVSGFIATFQNCSPGKFSSVADLANQVQAAPVDIPQSISQQIEDRVLRPFGRQSYIDVTGKADGATTPGMVIGVLTKDFTGVRAFGTKVINTNQPPDGNTFYGIGSVTKAFTGLILADEVSRGNLSLNQSAVELIQEPLRTFFSNVSGDLTLGRLVTHSSGLPSMPANLSALARVNRRTDMYGGPLPETMSEQTLRPV